MTLILASRSPRRRELMERMNLPFTCMSAEVDESGVIERLKSINPMVDPEEITQALALEKARSIAAMRPEAVIIGSDTVVVLENKILGKPENKQEAREMLWALCGKTHRVLTAVAIVKEGRERVFCSVTDVCFYAADEDTLNFIEEYIESGSPMDKAGAYGIQDQGALLIEGINGDYYTVMGFPVAGVWRELRQFAPELFTPPSSK